MIARARCQRGLDRGRRYVRRIRVDIGKDRARPDRYYAGRRCHEGPRRHHDVIAGTYAEDLQGQLERHGAIHHRNRVTGATPRGEFLLERASLAAGPVVNPIGAQHPGDSVNLFVGI